MNYVTINIGIGFGSATGCDGLDHDFAGESESDDDDVSTALLRLSDIDEVAEKRRKDKVEESKRLKEKQQISLKHFEKVNLICPLILRYHEHSQ